MFIQKFGEENKYLAVKEGKTSNSGLAAWFVSHCESYSGRKDFVEKLKKYIPVDIYGSCGNFKWRSFSLVSMVYMMLMIYMMMRIVIYTFISTPQIFSDWFRYCQKLFTRSQACQDLLAVKLNVNEGRDNLWDKTMQAFQDDNNNHYQNYDWFV